MPQSPRRSGFVRVRGARENNLKDVDVEIPRDALVVFTGVSGSGKSSLAFGTLYAEAQRRYLESVSPYARRLFDQMPVPEVDEIDGLPPAVALQQQRGTPTTRSSVGSVTTLSNLIRMLYSRAGTYPRGQSILYAESFSPNTPEGACPTCHGLGRVYEVTERSMVPDDTRTIRERAIAAWPLAWGGQNQRDILVSLGIDVDRRWRELPKKTRDWILFTEEQPVVPVYAGLSPDETRRAVKRKDEPSYMGTFTSAKRHVLHTFANTQSAAMKKRVQQYMLSGDCSTCHGKRLRRESLSVTFAGLDIAEMFALPLKRLATIFGPYADGTARGSTAQIKDHPEQVVVMQRIAEDLVARLAVLLDLGLGYLSLERSTPTLSPGELQRLRLATQIRSNLFGVVYVLDEPSAGLHPADTEALLRALDQLKDSGNTLFVVEHELDVIRHADWIVDVGPAGGELGGRVLYSGPLGRGSNRSTRPCRTRRAPSVRSSAGYRTRASHTARTRRLAPALRGHAQQPARPRRRVPARPVHERHRGVGIRKVEPRESGARRARVGAQLGHEAHCRAGPRRRRSRARRGRRSGRLGQITEGVEAIRRLVVVDQKPIGRTPRSNLATYTGLFDHVRTLFASTKSARARRYDAGRFSFNVAKGRCPHCEGEGFVFVEMLFLPSVYAPCPVCHGARYDPKTLEITYRDKNIADVLGLTVDAAWEFFADEPNVHRALELLREVGLGYLRLGQPATELSGGEAQRIKLATELQRIQRGNTLYVLDEPTTGLHPADVERLVAQLDRLVEVGNTVIVVEHDMRVVAGSDWVVDIGPGAGEDGGHVVAHGTPSQVAHAKHSRSAPYLARTLADAGSRGST